MVGDCLAICSYLKMLCSQRGMRFRRMRLIRVYGWVEVGHPSSSVVMGMDIMIVVDMGLPDQISGPPKG